jgi:hypothetical protein
MQSKVFWQVTQQATIQAKSLRLEYICDKTWCCHMSPTVFKYTVEYGIAAYHTVHITWCTSCTREQGRTGDSDLCASYHVTTHAGDSACATMRAM